MGNPGVTRPSERSGVRGRDKPALAYRLTDTYGLVLLLIILDYIVVSTLFGTAWGKFISIFFLASTLLFTLRVSRSRRIWQLMAAIYLVVITVSALISIFIPGDEKFSQLLGTLAGSLLLVTPFVILRRVIAHPVVTTETVLGAVCVYLIIGFSFAFIYSMLALVSPPPFFTGVSKTTIDETLFFSYSTLTTVGYGNLVPSISLGQTFAMLEALFGQIYLVLIVARLVSLWGQQVRPLPGMEGGKLPPSSSEAEGPRAT